jgi:uncharacterized membrane protein YdcZ (DUF606 family)
MVWDGIELMKKSPSKLTEAVQQQASTFVRSWHLDPFLAVFVSFFKGEEVMGRLQLLFVSHHVDWQAIKLTQADHQSRHSQPPA